eukprot:m.52248 g.52248  ORF g.52248 m.52248 type:complete len:464 (+) comp10775_c0_seq1:359-1750(+)
MENIPQAPTKSKRNQVETLSSKGKSKMNEVENQTSKGNKKDPVKNEVETQILAHSKKEARSASLEHTKEMKLPKKRAQDSLAEIPYLQGKRENVDEKTSSDRVQSEGAKHNICRCCKITHTRTWRKGPEGVIVCNACGIRYLRNGIYCPTCYNIPRNFCDIICHCAQCGSHFNGIDEWKAQRAALKLKGVSSNPGTPLSPAPDRKRKRVGHSEDNPGPNTQRISSSKNPMNSNKKGKIVERIIAPTQTLPSPILGGQSPNMNPLVSAAYVNQGLTYVLPSMSQMYILPDGRTAFLQPQPQLARSNQPNQMTQKQQQQIPQMVLAQSQPHMMLSQQHPQQHPQHPQHAVINPLQPSLAHPQQQMILQERLPLQDMPQGLAHAPQQGITHALVQQGIQPKRVHPRQYILAQQHGIRQGLVHPTQQAIQRLPHQPTMAQIPRMIPQQIIYTRSMPTTSQMSDINSH